MNIITFRTGQQLVLWNEEISSQISDGWWEGSGGQYGDKLWQAEAELGHQPGCNFAPGKYRFDLSEILEHEGVADRMLEKVRKFYSTYTREQMEADLAEMRKTIRHQIARAA